MVKKCILIYLLTLSASAYGDDNKTSGKNSPIVTTESGPVNITYNKKMKKIKKMKLEIIYIEDLLKLNNFLKNNRDNIVNLEIEICEGSLRDYSVCPVFSFTDYISDNTITDQSSSTFSAKFHGSDEKGGYMEVCNDYNGDDGSDGGNGGDYLGFSFGQKRWLSENFQKCSRNKGERMYSIEGYFLVPKNIGVAKGDAHWSLTPIKNSVIKLRDY